MIALLKQMGFQFLILHRNRLIIISAIVTLVYGIVLLFIKDLPNIDKFLVLLIYNDPAIIGLFFLGLSVIIEKNQNVLQALLVSPMNHHIYLILRIIALSLIGTACAAGMGIALKNQRIDWPIFLLGVFSTCAIFSILGILVVSYTTEFLHFMLRSIPAMLLLSLPLLNYFDLFQSSLDRFQPIYGPLQLLAGGLNSSNSDHIVSWILASAVWTLILYLVASKTFDKRLLKNGLQ